jgi:hypothetical protein
MGVVTSGFQSLVAGPAGRLSLLLLDRDEAITKPNERRCLMAPTSLSFMNDYLRGWEQECTFGRNVILAWAERDPVIAEAKRIVDEGQAGDLAAEDQYTPCFAYPWEWEAAGFSPEYMSAMMVLQECLQRGMPEAKHQEL